MDRNLGLRAQGLGIEGFRGLGLGALGASG